MINESISTWISLFSFTAVIFSCLAIWYKTSEIYELSSHKGINYFRNAFLFLGITYILIVLLISISLINDSSFITQTGLFLLSYSSSLAVFYLLYSIIWKRFPKVLYNVLIVNFLSLLLASLTLLAASLIPVAIILSLMILAGVSISLLDKKKKTQFYFAYLILFVISLLNSSSLFFVKFGIPKIFVIGTHVLTAILFVIILMGVIKRIK